MKSLVAPGIALILDMDGVIINSNPLHRAAWEQFNQRYGLETTEEMHTRMYGRRNDQIVRDFYGTGLDAGEVFARGAAKEALYRELLGQQVERALVPGVREFLQRYAEYPMALASNAEPANVDFVLDRAALRRYFRVVVDGYQVINPKPHPEVYLRAADQLGINPVNCVVFEDSLSGVEAALAAQMRVVGVRTTYTLLPGTVLDIDNFSNGTLASWLRVQRPIA